MARRTNELFIGTEQLNIQGRSIKHPALISEYGNLNLGKLSDEPIDLIGWDIETNHLTGKLMLLGQWDGDKYTYFHDRGSYYLNIIFNTIKYADYRNKAIAYWNKLDPYVLYKQFLLILQVDPDLVDKALDRFGKTGGEWDREAGDWSVKPLVELEIKGGKYRFGIKNVIRSSIQFFYYKVGSEWLNTVWAYDIAQLYQFGLEKEMLSRQDLFPYYSKIDKSAHLIDWDRFKVDYQYRKHIVLKSNEYDARGVYDLGMLIQEMFKNAFGYYIKTLVSTGSLARGSLVAVILKKYLDEGLEEKEAHKMMALDVKSIGFMNYYDSFLEQLGPEPFKDFYSLCTEAYSGGYIEAIRYGYSKEAYYSDIASAYPSVIDDLWDLRDSKITVGEGEPPRIPYSYCLIRGTVNIPRTVNYHPVTIKHPLKTLRESNIRATGVYVASYTIEERDFLIKQGATFKDEIWYNVETTGKKSPIADVVTYFIELRMRLLKEKNSAQYVAKISANSMYGILFECIDTYIDGIDGYVVREGYRAGEFFNPLFATYITARTRILISRATTEIERKGGKPILIMTDSIFWEGSPDMIPSELVREEKTLGFFEKPELVKDVVCLGTGRYSYFDTKKGYVASKKRGLNVTDFVRPEGVSVDVFNWKDALDIIKETKSREIQVKVRSLISVGMVKSSNTWTIEDLGRVVDVERTVDVVTGLHKRHLVNPKHLRDVTVLCDSMIPTKPVHIIEGMLGDGKIVDQTLPLLREAMRYKIPQTSGEKDLINRSKASTKHNKKGKVKKVRTERHKAVYNALKKYGYDSKTRNKMSKWSDERILNKLREDEKIDE